MKKVVYLVVATIAAALECIIGVMNSIFFVRYIIPNYSKLQTLIIGVVTVIIAIIITVLISNLDKYKFSKKCFESVVVATSIFVIVTSIILVSFFTDYLGIERGTDVYWERSIPVIISLVLVVLDMIIYKQHKELLKKERNKPYESE